MNTTYEKIGFIKKDKTEVVEKLNALLANYQLYYQKLRNFHWNVKGPEFFDIHERYEQEYNEVKVHIDEVAERIRTFGATPLSNLTGYLKIATIKESPADTPADDMMGIILGDIEVLIEFHIDAIGTANEIGDLSTADLLTKELKRIEKRHWMFTSFNSK